MQLCTFRFYKCLIEVSDSLLDVCEGTNLRHVSFVCQFVQAPHLTEISAPYVDKLHHRLESILREHIEEFSLTGWDIHRLASTISQGGPGLAQLINQNVAA